MKTKVYKILSILLSISLLFSTGIYASATETASSELTYYVCSPGYNAYGTTDADGSKEKPFETVYDLVDYVNNNTDLGAGDTLNAVILQRTDYNTAFGTATLNGASKGVHSITSWSYIIETGAASSIIPSHEYTLVLKSPEGEKNYLAYGAEMAANVDMKLAGPTVFDNVGLLNVRASNENKTLSFEGHSVTLTENSDFYWAKMYSSSWSPAKIYEDRAEYIQMYRLVANKEVSEPVNITLNGSYSNLKFYIPTLRNAGKNINYQQDVTITVNNQYAGIQFLWGNTSSSGVGVATFEKNLNIDIKSVGTLTNASSNAASVVANALQVIKPEGVDFTVPSNVVATNAWYLTNKTGNENALTFTETAGVYNVAEGLTVSAVDANGAAVSISADGVLDLSDVGAGTYSIVEGEVSGGGTVPDPDPNPDVDPDRTEYYVKSPGYNAYGTTEANGTEANPFETVYDLIQYVNTNGSFTADDTITAIILQRPDCRLDGSFGSASLRGSSTYVHGFTSWSYIDDGNASTIVPEHSYTLLIKSPEGLCNNLAYSAKMGANVDMKLGGPTVFDNVTLLNVRYGNENKTVYSEDNNVTFTENCKWAWTKTRETGAWDKAFHSDRGEFVQMVRAYSGTYTYDKTVDINISAPVGNGTTGIFKFYIPSLRSNSANAVYNKDVTITVDNPSAKLDFTWGNNQASSPATVFGGNLNINVKNATLISNTDGLGAITVNGALQILAPYDVNFQDITAFDGITAAKARLLNVRTQEGAELGFVTDQNGNTTEGKFTVTEGFIALAADQDGNVVKTSSEGILDLTDYTGTYTIRFVDDYDNDGSVITVYKPCEIDLSKVFHDDIPGKVFIGWAFKDGTYPEKVASYKIGDMLYAQYADFTDEDFKTEEIQIRDDGNDGDPSLRFIHSMKTGALPNVIERGTLVLPVSESYGAEMYLDEKVVLLWTANAEVAEFNPREDGVGAVPVTVTGENILTETEDTLKYTLCITNIAKEDYDTYYAVRGYIKFADNNGLSYIFYADQEVSSLYNTATKSEEKTETENAIISYVENDRVANYWLANGLTADGRITAETETQYLDTGCGCYGSDTCTHKIFRMPTSTKLYVRDIFINGLDIEETEIAFITDTHFDYVNQNDIAANSSALQTYRTRQTFIEHSQKYVNYGIMEFASMFKKMVHGGDVIDYLSWGSILTADRLITKQSVNNLPIRKLIKDGSGGYTSQKLLGSKYSMVVGNHDAVNGELVNLNPSAVSLFAAAEGTFDKMRPYWTNDLSYDSEILLDSNGNDKLMLVYLDNSFVTYNEYQYNQFKVDIEYARNNNVPVLIFQHRPMLTMNPDETEFKDITGYYNAYMFAPQDNKYYDITEDAKGNKVYTVKSDIPEVAACAGIVASATDMTSFSGYSGYGVEVGDEDVYNLIRQNADIIKGVFCGHIHANTESHIIGIDENGNDSGYTIPQYTGYLANYGSAARIILS